MQCRVSGSPGPPGVANAESRAARDWPGPPQPGPETRPGFAPLSAGHIAETVLFVTVTNKTNERVGHVARIQQRQVPMTIDRKVPTASRREFTG